MKLKEIKNQLSAATLSRPSDVNQTKAKCAYILSDKRENVNRKEEKNVFIQKKLQSV